MSNEDPDDFIKQGDQLFNQGNYQAALGCFTQAVALARQSGQTRVELDGLDFLTVCWANLGENTKMAEAAARLLARAKQLDNQNYQMRAGLRLATALARIDLPTRWPEIRQVLLDGLHTARLLADDWSIVYHLDKLGQYAQQMGEAEAAYAWLQDALNTLTPATYGAMQFRLRIYRSFSLLAERQGQRADALRYAEMALGAAREDRNPAFIAAAQHSLAEIQRWLGERAEALALVEEALATFRRLNLQGDTVECLALKVALLVDLGLREQAEEAYTALCALDLHTPDHYRFIGEVAYRSMRDLPRAAQAYRQFLAGRPTHPEGQAKLALALFEQGQVTEAVRQWRGALQQRNEYPEALLGLGLGLWTLGERAEAVTIVGQGVGLEPRVVDEGYLEEEYGWSQPVLHALRPLLSEYHLSVASVANGDRGNRA